MSSSAIRPSRRSLVVLCIMLSLFMSAIEVTIVATAMPQIVRELGGFSLYAWVFSAFLLTQTATTVIFGKLSDIYGRKPVIVGGTIVFLIGSALCGVAWSMGSMIVFRLLQGIGAGSMQPVAVTIAGDLYTPRERLKIQAALSAVWAGAAMVGHHDRKGLNDSAPMLSWNSSHPSRGADGGCSQADLKSTGGDGLLYCLAGN